jgi:hypothetical protein
MRGIKVLVVVGVAVALVAAPALAARVTIEISGTAQSGDLFIRIDTRTPVKVTLTAGQAIEAVRNAIVSALNNQKPGTAEAISTSQSQLLINADSSIWIGEAPDRLMPLIRIYPPVETVIIPQVQARGLIFKVVQVDVPTLTEWGLIALAVLLAGSLAFMIRRRFTCRPAGT